MFPKEGAENLYFGFSLHLLYKTCISQTLSDFELLINYYIFLLTKIIYMLENITQTKRLKTGQLV